MVNRVNFSEKFARLLVVSSDCQSENDKNKIELQVSILFVMDIVY